MAQKFIRNSILLILLTLSAAFLFSSYLYPRNYTAFYAQPNQAIISDETQTSSTHRLIISSHEGYVAVYDNGALLFQTDIPVVSLPAADRNALETGISVEDSVALHRLLEDLGA